MRTRDSIQPFWERMPQTFAYGFHGASMAIIAGFAILSVLGSYLPGLLSTAVWVLCLMAVYKFSYEVLVWTAKGHLDPPEGYALGVSDGIFWQQLAMWFFLYGALFWLSYLVPFPLWLVMLALVILATPVMIMILAIDQNIGAALTPGSWFAVMGRVGLPYLLLVIFLILMIVSRQYAGAWLGFLPPFLAAIIAAVIGNYFMVIMFHMMGYVVFQYHQELGFEPDDPGFDPKKGLKDSADPDLVKAEALMAEGQMDAAREPMQIAVNKPQATIETHMKYLKLLDALDAARAWQEHAVQVVSMLMSAKRSAEALPIVQKLLQHNAKFDLHDDEWTARLIQSALNAGRPKLALKLSIGFHKRYPDSARTVDIYLQAAKLLSQRFNQDDKAIALLKLIERDYSDHPLAPEATQERQALQSL